MRKPIVVACTFVLLLAVATAASAAEPPSKEVLARELVEISGGAETVEQRVRQMMAAFPQQSEEGRKLQEALLAELDAAAFLETMVSIYARHFTVAEMEAAIAFYRTPEGQSFLEKLALVSVELAPLSQKWAAEALERAQARLEAEADAAAPAP